MKFIYKKTKSHFKKIKNINFQFETGNYQIDSANRIKHDFRNVLLSASLNQRRDDKTGSVWFVKTYEDNVPIDIPSFTNCLDELSNIMSNYGYSETFYGVIEYVIQRTSNGYEIFDVSFR